MLLIRKYREGSKSGFIVTGELSKNLSGGQRKRIRKKFSGIDAKIKARAFRDSVQISDEQNRSPTMIRETLRTAHEEREVDRLVHLIRRKLNDMETDPGQLLRTAVDHFLASPVSSHKSVSVNEAVEIYLKRKHALKISDNHRKEVGSKLGKFSTLYGDRPLSSITPDEVEHWVEDRDVSERTKETYYNAIHALFAYSVKKCLITHNVVGVMDKPTPATYGEPKSLTPDQIAELFRIAAQVEEGSMIPYLVIALFGGVRVAEVGRADWEDFDWDENILRVRHRKGGQEYLRAVEIPEVGMKWLEYVNAREKSGKIFPPSGLKRFNVIRAAAGFRIAKGNLLSTDFFGLDDLIKGSDSSKRPEWPFNAMRHTGITYRYKQIRSIDEVAEWAGNSPKKIKKHYQSVNGVTAKAVEDYFNLTPERLLAQ